MLYLCRSLSFSYSSIASYQSMLSGVFRFILPELSSHFVFHDLLRSFRLERPLPSSRVPLWDLLLVLRFLRGPPFEPLSACSLRDLTQKVLFPVSLATARRVGELQAVSRDVSFSDSDIYLSCRPEFRAKTESSVNLLLCAAVSRFCWRSSGRTFARSCACASSLSLACLSSPSFLVCFSSLPFSSRML